LPAGLLPRHVTGCKRGHSVDYIISGITALFLLVYLLYALLRPERF